VQGKQATIGVTDHAQKQLGDIVYVELPKPGIGWRRASRSARWSR
jgi:glycine cleavage system H protein